MFQVKVVIYQKYYLYIYCQHLVNALYVFENIASLTIEVEASVQNYTFLHAYCTRVYWPSIAPALTLSQPKDTVMFWFIGGMQEITSLTHKLVFLLIMGKKKCLKINLWQPRWTQMKFCCLEVFCLTIVTTSSHTVFSTRWKGQRLWRRF